MEKKKIIKIRDAAPETAPLSPGVSFRSLLFTSGQVSKDLKTGNPKLGTIEEETEQVLSNIEAVLKEAGTSSVFSAPSTCDWRATPLLNMSSTGSGFVSTARG